MVCRGGAGFWRLLLRLRGRGEEVDQLQISTAIIYYTRAMLAERFTELTVGDAFTKQQPHPDATST
jgi:hypothetical protein